MNINIQPNKHIALLLTPRSGSTVLRAWLASSLNYLNLSELFNVNVVPPKILIEGEDVFVKTKLFPVWHWVVSFTINWASGIGYTIICFVTESVHPLFDVAHIFTV